MRRKVVEEGLEILARAAADPPKGHMRPHRQSPEQCAYWGAERLERLWTQKSPAGRPKIDPGAAMYPPPRDDAGRALRVEQIKARLLARAKRDGGIPKPVLAHLTAEAARLGLPFSCKTAPVAKRSILADLEKTTGQRPGKIRDESILNSNTMEPMSRLQKKEHNTEDNLKIDWDRSEMSAFDYFAKTFGDRPIEQRPFADQVHYASSAYYNALAQALRRQGMLISDVFPIRESARGGAIAKRGGAELTPEEAWSELQRRRARQAASAKAYRQRQKALKH